MIGLWSINKIVGFLDRNIKKLYSVEVCMLAVHSLIRVESRNSACVIRREFVI